MPRKSASKPKPNATPKKPRGKPASKIDIVDLEKLAGLHCTIEEAAAFFRCTKMTLLRYLDPTKRDPAYREAWERGRLQGKASLRRLQWQHAQMQNSAGVTMSIHLAKHWLGETEKSLVEMTGKNGGPIQTIDLTTATDDDLATIERIFGQAAVAGGDNAGGQSGTGA